MNSLQLLGTLELTLIYSLVALGVYLSFKIIQFADLTVDGSFALGGAVCASLILQGTPAYIATLAAIFAGALAGYVTSLLHLKLKMVDLLSGILTMSALYSINLRIMDSPNLSLFGVNTLFSSRPQTLLLLAGFSALSYVLIWRFLSSEHGLALRACGQNPEASASYGVPIDRMKALGLAISNALVALAGALFAQSQGFSDISMGLGTLIMGLAAVIVGCTLLRADQLPRELFSIFAGIAIYRLAIAIALNTPSLGLRASDMNLLTCAIVTCMLWVSRSRGRKA